jgi:hypothetical protein
VTWIIPADLEYKPAPPPCVVLCDPDKDLLRCGRPAESGHTILDFPLCDQCFDAIRL